MEDIEVLVKNYKAPERAKNIVKQMKFALIVGITGAGKNAIQDELFKSGEYEKIITTIPRAPRAHEKDGVDYYFINDETVRQNLLNQEYFEVKIVHGRPYGTTTKELERVVAKNKTTMADVDVQGVDEYYAVAGDNVTAIFLIPPDYGTWYERLFGRSKFSNSEIARRIESAIMEIRYALNRDYYHFVINDDLIETAKLADKIIHGEFSNYDDSAARAVAEKLLNDIIARSSASGTL